MNNTKTCVRFLTSIPSIFDTEGVEIYDGRNTIKSFILPNGETINVKRFRKPSFFNLLVYSFNIRKPKGLRAFQFPYILKKKQIETPQSVAYIEERNGLHLLQYTYYAYIKCPYTNDLYDMGGKRDGEAFERAEALAAFTAHMHNEGVLHKDFFAW